MAAFSGAALPKGYFSLCMNLFVLIPRHLLFSRFLPFDHDSIFPPETKSHRAMARVA